jgi:hypothetical protein
MMEHDWFVEHASYKACTARMLHVVLIAWAVPMPR